MYEDVVFLVLAVTAVGSGVTVFRFDSMARATYALLLSLLCVGGLAVLLGLEYLGVVTILMMTIEMAVMAVFMVMFMMNPAGLMPMSMLHNTKAAAALCTGLFVALAAGVLLVDWPGREGRAPADATKALGLSLMGPQMLTMMTLGMALFATIVSTVVLATRRGRYGPADCARDDGPAPGPDVDGPAGEPATGGDRP